MSMKLRCKCGKRFKVPEGLVGHHVKCPYCSRVARVKHPVPAGQAEGGERSAGDAFDIDHGVADAVSPNPAANEPSPGSDPKLAGVPMDVTWDSPADVADKNVDDPGTLPQEKTGKTDEAPRPTAEGGPRPRKIDDILQWLAKGSAAPAKIDEGPRPKAEGSPLPGRINEIRQWAAEVSAPPAKIDEGKAVPSAPPVALPSKIDEGKVAPAAEPGAVPRKIDEGKVVPSAQPVVVPRKINEVEVAQSAEHVALPPKIDEVEVVQSAEHVALPPKIDEVEVVQSAVHVALPPKIDEVEVVQSAEHVALPRKIEEAETVQSAEHAALPRQTEELLESAEYRPLPPRKSHRWLMVSLTCLLLAAVSGAAWYFGAHRLIWGERPKSANADPAAATPPPTQATDPQITPAVLFLWKERLAASANVAAAFEQVKNRRSFIEQKKTISKLEQAEARLIEEFERLPVDMKELVKKTYARQLEETVNRRKAAMVKAMKSEK